MKEYDMFGNEIVKDVILKDLFVAPPFTILDARSGDWQKRKQRWINLGIRGEVGRDAPSIHFDSNSYEGNNNSVKYTSVFDPALCEVSYKWFCKEGGRILDPFAGGSVRGVVAGYLGYSYLGIDIRQEQVDENISQVKDIVKDSDKVSYICGDSNKVLRTLEDEGYDMVFSCPPYADLEKYSDLEGDISNMDYDGFKIAYRRIISQACEKLKSGCYAVFVVGEVRDKQGNYIGLVPETIDAFVSCGMKYYNEAILVTPVASVSMRAVGNMKTCKLVKTHQNYLCFKKP